MESELPSEFDLIVIGTGFVESVVAAAASRIGKTVLHIDNNDYYGGLWASFTLDGIYKLQRNSDESNLEAFDDSLNMNLPPNQKLYNLANTTTKLDDLDIRWNIPETTENENEWSQKRLLNESRRFNLDLMPKLHFARGEFVELLISSNVARYSEFRSVSRILTWLDGRLQLVPCSRSDVFANNNVSVIEKRLLMKLFATLETDDVLEGYESKTFKTFLHDKKLTANLIHFVLYAIAMCEDSTICSDGIQNVRKFLNSLGRFGKTPLLYSSYGSGELTQAFCRLSAVFGAVYALNQSIHSLLVDENNADSLRISVNQQTITADKIVIGIDRATHLNTIPTENTLKHHISRAIFITDRSILSDSIENLTLLLYPPEGSEHLIYVIEGGSATGICPQNLCVVHMISMQSTTPEEDFKYCTFNLFNQENSPRILWSSYFSIPIYNIDDNERISHVSPKLFVCDGHDFDVDYDTAIEKAKSIFKMMYADCEFLPRAPDPEEIIIEGEALENHPNEEDTVQNATSLAN